MTQALIDNSGRIIVQRDVTISQTVAQSRRVKSFRRGPFQTLIEVSVNPIMDNTWRPIEADLSSTLTGPYALQLPASVMGPLASDYVLSVDGVQSDNTLDILSDATATGELLLAKGDLIQIDNVDGTYKVTADVLSINSNGDATVILDQPLLESAVDQADINANSQIVFQCNLFERPQATFVPSGNSNQTLVSFSDTFVFREIVG